MERSRLRAPGHSGGRYSLSGSSVSRPTGASAPRNAASGGLSACGEDRSQERRKHLFRALLHECYRGGRPRRRHGATSGQRDMTRLAALPRPQLRTAHDVRHLVGCARCRRIGDRRQMVSVAGRDYHGRCFVRGFGLPALIALAPVETDKLTLGDLGRVWMRQLLDARAPKRKQGRRG